MPPLSWRPLPAATLQERERKERERVVRAKLAASAFARGYLNGIVTSVFQTLQDTGGLARRHALRSKLRHSFGGAPLGKPLCKCRCRAKACPNALRVLLRTRGTVRQHPAHALTRACTQTTPGFFVDPVEKEVEEMFMPWLQQAAAQHLERSAAAHAVVQQLVADAVVLRAEQRAAAMAAADAAAAAAAAAAERAAAEAAARAAAELEAIRRRAALILRGLDPPLVDEDAAAQARAELQTQAQGDAEAAWEAERARVGEARRAQLEAEATAAATAQQVRH